MSQTKSAKILLTGGHGATTAISVVEELLRRSQTTPAEIYWIGAKKAIEGSGVYTLESRAFPALGVNSFSIEAGRIPRKFTRWSLYSFAKIPLGFVSGFRLLALIKPDIIVSFGGFAAFPVVFLGWLMRIPIILHEQTLAAGFANRLSVPFARKIALARKESLKYFPVGKSLVVGNPIMTQISEILPKKTIGKPPTIYVTGGSRGSTTLNGLIGPILKKLLENFYVIHHTGELDFAKFAKVKKELTGKLRQRYEVYPKIDPMQIDGVYKRADVLIGRAGANTVSEIIALKIPSIFIPIPFSYQDEQSKNAKFAQRLGLADVLSQEEASSKKLLGLIYKIVGRWDSYVSQAKSPEISDKDASRKLVDLILTSLTKHEEE